MIECSLASAATGRLVSGLAPLCRSQVIRSRLCVLYALGGWPVDFRRNGVIQLCLN